MLDLVGLATLGLAALSGLGAGLLLAGGTGGAVLINMLGADGHGYYLLGWVVCV